LKGKREGGVTHSNRTCARSSLLPKAATFSANAACRCNHQIAHCRLHQRTLRWSGCIPESRRQAFRYSRRFTIKTALQPYRVASSCDKQRTRCSDKKHCFPRANG
jgi:hypothetical protein